jgi:signal peptidase I
VRTSDRDGDTPSLSAYAGEREPDTFIEEDPSAPDLTSPKARPRPSFTRWLIEILLTLIAAAVLAFAIKAWVLEARQIPSTSMEQTLLVGDRVLVEKLSYRLRAPVRPDVVVFDAEDAPGGAIIKRVIAVAGQRVDIRDGVVYIDGQRIIEPYVNSRYPDHYDADAESLVPTGTVFVMGDNRANSNDSRYIGPVPLSSIIGRAFAIYWPLDRLSGL